MTSGGCWRTLQGLIDFAVVQSYLSTATKWGINGWSESLRQELLPDVRVTLVERDKEYVQDRMRERRHDVQHELLRHEEAIELELLVRGRRHDDRVRCEHERPIVGNDERRRHSAVHGHGDGYGEQHRDVRVARQHAFDDLDTLAHDRGRLHHRVAQAADAVAAVFLDDRIAVAASVQLERDGYAPYGVEEEAIVGG